MSLLNTNFVVDERTIIDRTTDPELDGKSGTVVGKTADDLSNIYIVLLDHPLSCGDRAKNITEACLFRESDPKDSNGRYLAHVF